MSAVAEEVPAKIMDTAEWPYRFDVLDVSSMIVDYTYQRPLTAFHKKIAEKFDPALVGTLVVSDRKPGSQYTDAEGKRRKVGPDGAVAIVDGQTRWGAATVREIEKLPCLVYMEMTVAQEASLFARLQKERKGIASFHRFRAAMIAGDKEPLDIASIVRDAGYEVGVSGREPNEITAVAALEAVYRRGPEILERTLLILKEAWGDEHLPAAEHIRGLAYFLSSKPEVDDERMASKLGKSTPTELKITAGHLREGAMGGGTSEKYMAGAMEAVYNRRGR